MKEKLKNIRPILKRVPQMVDPIRFPKVINSFEGQSKKDFEKSLDIEQEHLLNQMLKYIE
jgi:hypothetical protein